MVRLVVVAAAALAPLGLGCGPPPLECVEVALDCAPQYPPTFANVYANTLDDDCSASACHDAVAPKGGLDLSEIETAYDELLDGRVTPGDVSCSELTMRLFTDIAEWHMPRGETLSDSEKCAVAQWVSAGALRADAPDAGILPDASP